MLNFSIINVVNKNLLGNVSWLFVITEMSIDTRINAWNVTIFTGVLHIVDKT